MTAEMETLTADLLAKCYHQKTRVAGTDRPAVDRPTERESSPYAPPSARAEIPPPGLGVRPPLEETL